MFNPAQQLMHILGKSQDAHELRSLWLALKFKVKVYELLINAYVVAGCVVRFFHARRAAVLPGGRLTAGHGRLGSAAHGARAKDATSHGRARTPEKNDGRVRNPVANRAWSLRVVLGRYRASALSSVCPQRARPAWCVGWLAPPSSSGVLVQR